MHLPASGVVSRNVNSRRSRVTACGPLEGGALALARLWCASRGEISGFILQLLKRRLDQTSCVLKDSAHFHPFFTEKSLNLADCLCRRGLLLAQLLSHHTKLPILKQMQLRSTEERQAQLLHLDGQVQSALTKKSSSDDHRNHSTAGHASFRQTLSLPITAHLLSNAITADGSMAILHGHARLPHQWPDTTA